MCEGVLQKTFFFSLDRTHMKEDKRMFICYDWHFGYVKMTYESSNSSNGDHYRDETA